MIRLGREAIPDEQNKDGDGRPRSCGKETFVASFRMTLTVTERCGWDKDAGLVGRPDWRSEIGW